MRFPAFLFIVFVISIISCKPYDPVVAPDFEPYFDASIGSNEFVLDTLIGYTYNGSVEIVATATDNRKVTVSLPAMPENGTLPYEHPISIFYEAPGQPIIYETLAPNYEETIIKYNSETGNISTPEDIYIYLHRNLINGIGPGKNISFNFGNLVLVDTVAPVVQDRVEVEHLTGGNWGPDTFNLTANNINVVDNGSYLDFDIVLEGPGFQGSNLVFNINKSVASGYKDESYTLGNWEYAFAGSNFTSLYANISLHVLRHDPIGRRITMGFSGNFISVILGVDVVLKYGYMDVGY
jgi:hypothetical protein